MLKKPLSLIIGLCFFLNTFGPIPYAHADSFLGLPAPGTIVSVSPNFQPALIRGLTVHKNNPFLFDFIVDPGQSKLAQKNLKEEADRMIKYFFAALTIPDKDVWVNLSPYEKDRMIPVSLGETAMGRDLLAQDYMLKQLTASLIYPQKALGKTFWTKVYAKAKEMYGTTQIPVNTFNKVWIVPQRVGIYEHGQTAFIVDGHLKVMLEEDYLASRKHGVILSEGPLTGHSQLLAKDLKAHKDSFSSQIIRQLILPEIEKEINEGKNFATLRQIFYAQALAVWFKHNLKQALLNHVYANKGTVRGIDQNNPGTNEGIYQQYLRAYKKGVFNYIQEDIDPVTQETLPRKYFSGGYNEAMLARAIQRVKLSPNAARHEATEAAHDVYATVVVASNKNVATELDRSVAFANKPPEKDAAMWTVRARDNFKPIKLRVDLKSHRKVRNISDKHLSIYEARLILKDATTKNQLEQLIELAGVRISFKEARLIFANRGTISDGMMIGLFNKGETMPSHLILLNGYYDPLVREYLEPKHSKKGADFLIEIHGDRKNFSDLTGVRSRIDWDDGAVVIEPNPVKKSSVGVEGRKQDAAMRVDAAMKTLRVPNNFRPMELRVMRPRWVSNIYDRNVSIQEAGLILTDSKTMSQLQQLLELTGVRISFEEAKIIFTNDGTRQGMMIGLFNNDNGGKRLLRLIFLNGYDEPLAQEYIEQGKIINGFDFASHIYFNTDNLSHLTGVRSRIDWDDGALFIEPDAAMSAKEEERTLVERILEKAKNKMPAQSSRKPSLDEIEGKPDDVKTAIEEGRLSRYMANGRHKKSVPSYRERIDPNRLIFKDGFTIKIGEELNYQVSPSLTTKVEVRQIRRIRVKKYQYVIILKDISNGQVYTLPLMKLEKHPEALTKDRAMATPGGIDLGEQGAALRVTKDANGGVEVNVDPALIARVEREGIRQAIPVIINMRPADLHSLFQD